VEQNGEVKVATLRRTLGLQLLLNSDTLRAWARSSRMTWRYSATTGSVPSYGRWQRKSSMEGRNAMVSETF
jgi:hypothetical protein